MSDLTSRPVSLPFAVAVQLEGRKRVEIRADSYATARPVVAAHAPGAILPDAWPWCGQRQAPARPGKSSSYEYVTCPSCGQDWQRIDYGCARHHLYHPEGLQAPFGV